MSKITANDIKRTQREAFTNVAEAARRLADAIESDPKRNIDPDKNSLCNDALRAYAAQVDAGFALVAPPAAPGE